MEALVLLLVVGLAVLLVQVAGLKSRIERLERRARTVSQSAHSRPQSLRLERRIGTTAQQRPLLDARLKTAQAAATGPARTVLDTIVAWDGNYDREDSRGTVDPGVAAFEALKEAVEDTLPAAAVRLLGQRGGSHPFDMGAAEAEAFHRSSQLPGGTMVQRPPPGGSRVRRGRSAARSSYWPDPAGWLRRPACGSPSCEGRCACGRSCRSRSPGCRAGRCAARSASPARRRSPWPCSP